MRNYIRTPKYNWETWKEGVPLSFYFQVKILCPGSLEVTTVAWQTPVQYAGAVSFSSSLCLRIK